MSTSDASTEAKTIAALDHQSDKGADSAAAQLNKDYQNVLKENGGDVTKAQQWLKDTTAELAKQGVLPDISIGVLSNEFDNLSADGNKVTQHDLIHDNFLLQGSTGAQQSFDAFFTNMLSNDTNSVTDQVTAELGSKDGS
ncbi:MAG: hypothetical protein ACRD3W_17775, partial [Terriglobales bacterium]